MKRLALRIFVALLACAVLSCPSPRRSVTLRILNESSQITVTSVTVAKITGIASSIEHITDNLLTEAVEPDEEDTIVIPMDLIADGNGFAVSMEGGSTPLKGFKPSDPLDEGSGFLVRIGDSLISIESE